jgi:hypothetical protein
MSKKRKSNASRRLGLAMVLVGVSAVLFYVVIDGHIYDASNGSAVGLYGTIAALFLGLASAVAALGVSASVFWRASKPVQKPVAVKRAGEKNKKAA